MALKGDLASVDLAQVFQMLALNQKEGMLLITTPRGWRALYFNLRGTYLYFDEHVLLERVLTQSIRTGRIEPDHAQLARDHAADHGLGLADALVDGGFLDPEELAAMIRAEMEEEVYDLFFWDDARFEFFEGCAQLDGREGQIDERFSFSPDSLIMEAARRIDEWSYIQSRVPTAFEVLRPLGNAANFVELEDFALGVYDLVDGKRNVSRLIEVSGLPPFLVYKGLATLLDEALIESVPVGDLLPVARDCVAEGRSQDAVNLFERAISMAEGVPEAHEEVASCYDQLQEFELAAYHRKCMAEFFVRVEKVDRAVAVLRKIVAILPTDLAARERMVELSVGRQDLATPDFDPVRSGKELVDLYLAAGEVDRVRAVLERLLRDNPYDVELKKSLVNVHTKAGDTKRVVQLYESIAEDYVQQRRPIDAVKYLQKVLIIDRSRKDISDRIRALYELDERRRSRRRSVMVVLALSMVLIALAGLWFGYDRHARNTLDQLETEVGTLIEAGDYDRAAEQYEAFKAGYPFTTAVAKADILLTSIEGLRRNQEQLEANERRRRDAELRKLRDAYQFAMTIYQGRIQARDFDGALQQAEEIQKLVRDAGEPVDLAWAKDQRLDEQVAMLQEQLGRALALDREARQKLRQGAWREARALWLQLTEDYVMTETARYVKLPVRLVSRPPGAVVQLDGEALMVQGPGGEEPARTPCVVELPPQQTVRVLLEREGFEPREVDIVARDKAEHDVVLTAVPAGVLRFEQPVRGRISLRSGVLAAGLREGRVAFRGVGENAGSLDQEVALPGLDSIEGAVAFYSAMALFRTSEGWVEARSLHDGKLLWRRRLPDGARAIYDPLVVGRRVVFADDRGRLVALDASRGGEEPIWELGLGGTISHPPTSDGRRLHVVVGGDTLVLIDVAEGRVERRVNCADIPTTAVHGRKGALVYGSESGKIIALRARGTSRLWVADVPGGGRVEQLQLVGETVLARTAQGHVVAVELRRGAIEAAAELPGRIVSGPVVTDERIFVTSRQLEGRREVDVLLALDPETLERVWEYRGSGRFASDIAAFGAEVYVPSSTGEVLWFR